VKSTLQKLTLAAAVVLVVGVPSALGQNYPKPYKQGATPTVCPTATPSSVCPGTNSVGQDNVGLKTYPYSSPLVTHVGRFLDSSFVTNFQHVGIRTLRARRVRIARKTRGSAPPRAYIQLGSAIGVYSLDRFFTTSLPAGMVNVKSVISTVRRGDYVPENVVKWDALIHPEAVGEQDFAKCILGMTYECTPYADGQDRLFDFDFDDRGYVYLAAGKFGWLVYKDGGETGGDRLDFMGQVIGASNSIDDPRMIVALKTGGKYYAVISDDTSQEGRIVYDATNPAGLTPNGAKKIGYQYAFISWAKDDANERVAIIVGPPKSRKIEIYNYSTLVSGGSPIFTYDGGNKDFKDITVDENGNFWTSEVTEAVSSNNIIKLERSGGSYTPRSFDVFGGPFTSEDVPNESYNTIEYGDKYLTVVGKGSGSQQDVRLFKIEGGEPVAVPLNEYFKKYYWFAPRDYAEPPGSDQSYGVYPIKWNNKTYLIQSTLGLGDVYELQAGDSISVAQKAGQYGTTNPNAPSSSDVFYGDILRFRATSSNPSFEYNVNWNFGNDEAGPDNTPAGRTGQDIDYQYTGLNTANKIQQTRTAKAIATSNSDINDAITLTMKVPVARIGVKGTNVALTTDNASLDVIAGDNFADSSDGSVQGHYSHWTIDGGPIDLLPNASAPVGTVGAHTVTLAATYGKYNGSFVTTGSPYVDSVSNVSYTVRPFVAAFGTHAKTVSGVTFKGTARKSTLVTASQWTVQWSLKTPGGADVVPPTSQTAAVGTVPDFLVNVTIPNKSILKLKISVDAAGLAPAAVNYSSHEVSQELLTPDPKVTKSGCANVGSPCTFTVSSTGSNPMDGWTFAWTLKRSGNQVASGAGATFSPSLTEIGSYTATVVASTTIFSGTDDEGPFTVEPSVCDNPPTDRELSIHASCTVDCPTNTDIAFEPNFFGYSPQECETYQWNFGDGQTATSTFAIPEVKHKYSAKGTKTVSLTVKLGTQSSPTVTQSVKIGNDIIVDPCAGLTAPSNISISYNGSKGCRLGVSCKTGETITFTGGRGSLGLHTCDSASWDFGDGTSGGGKSTTKSYASPGNYSVSLVVSNSLGTASPVSISIPVIQDNACAAPPAASSLYIEFSGAVSGCKSSNTKTCNSNETLTFKPRGFPVDNFQACDKFEWDFGDGSAKTNVREPTHSFAGNVASYRVVLRVFNDTNSEGSTVNINVPFPAAVKPTPKLSWTSFPARGSKGTAVTFSVQSDINATGWTWQFGDESADTSQAGITSKSSTITHTYSFTGTYTVSVSARNAEDSSAAPTDIEVGTITVDNTPEYRYLLPVVAHAAGIGSTWRTDVQIYSPDPSVSASNPMLMTANFKGTEYTLVVDKSTYIYEDFLNNLRPGQNDQGPVIISVKTLVAPQIWSRTYNQTEGGTFGQFIPAIRLDQVGSGSAVGAGNYHLAGLRSNSRYRTNVGIVNPNPQTIPVTLTTYDDLNVPFGSSITKQLGPFQLDQFPVTGPAERPFSIDIQVPEGSWLIAYASLIDGGSSDPVFMQAIRSSELSSADYRTSVIPGVGHVGDWRSDVTIFNPYNHGLAVELEYYDQGGTKVANATVPVGPGMFVQYLDILKQGVLGNVADSLGMLRVNVPSGLSPETFPMTFARTYNDNGTNKTYGQGIAGFAAARANVKATKGALIPGVRSDASYKTNVGLTNLTSSPVTVTVKVLSEVTGAEVASYSYPLNANQSVVAPDVNLAGNTRASLKVEATGNVWAFASIIDRRTLDPEYVPASPLP